MTQEATEELLAVESSYIHCAGSIGDVERVSIDMWALPAEVFYIAITVHRVTGISPPPVLCLAMRSIYMDIVPAGSTFDHLRGTAVRVGVVDEVCSATASRFHSLFAPLLVDHQAVFLSSSVATSLMLNPPTCALHAETSDARDKE